MLVDKGATANVMDEITFKRLLADEVTLRRSSSVLRAYQSNENPTAPLKVMGKFEAIVKSNTRIAPATFHVIKGHTNTEPLIGFQTITRNLLKEYADLFLGIGKMKGVKVDLHVDPAITPVAQAHRRIPFSVRPKLEAEWEKIEADNIIERVEKPTSWASPVVITPKRSSNEIRLNVDMREANKAIPRTYTVMPTLDDIIKELNGATVFSHLDMNHGYHQLELEENSRDITTFATHVGLYRYKRLNFGTRSAGEKFQETVSKEITRDIAYASASVTISLYSAETKRNNKDKCLYYGMVFSKEGAFPDPMKVEAIKQAEPSRNAKELNSFRCTVQFNARFIESYAPQTNVLRALVRADVFKWEEKHREAFEALKNALSADTVLAYFDPAADHEVHVDGCPRGISATLVQRSPNEGHWRVVQYASRALSDAERRYSTVLHLKMETSF